LDTIQGEINVSFKVIIVDNSTTNSLPYDYKNCKVCRAKSKIGYGRAVNIGLFEAVKTHAQKIIILNQDAIAPLETIRTLFTELDNIGPDSILLPIVKGIDDNKIPTYYLEFLASEGFSEKNLLDSGSKLEIRKGEIGFPAFAIKSQFIKTVGGFDPIFFMYCEDLDIIKRIRQKGGKIYFLGNCFVKHRKSIFDFKTNLETKRRNMWNQHSKFILLLKYNYLSFGHTNILLEFYKYFDIWNLTKFKGNLYQSYLLTKNYKHIVCQLSNESSLLERITYFVEKDIRSEGINN
jgi:GT2 family glycosyltransferase